jgi:RimJ/RimL family protein N-acetyltransferase
VLTDRLDLRAVDLADVDALHPILADPPSSAFLPGGTPASPGDTIAWLERFVAGWEEDGLGYWTVRLRGEQTVIGVGGAARRPQFWNLLYFVHPAHRGNGYATELARAGQEAARSSDPGLPVAAWIHEQNAASQAVARRLGLRDYGRLEAIHWKGQPMHYWADREPAGNLSA